MALALSLVLSPAWAQDRVQTRAWPHPGFARIVFDWPSPVAYEARIEGASLVIAFERSLSSDFSRMERFLPEYVSGSSLSEDGKTLTVALKGAFGLRTSTSNTSIVVDLLQEPANTKAEAEAKPPEPEKVRVRFGEHPNFTRVVFDWTRNVDYKVEKTGATVGIRFGSDARFDLSRLATGEFPLVNTASSRSENGRAVVEFQVADATRFRHFRDGTKVVIDILRGADRPAAAPAQKTPVDKAAPPQAPPRAALPAPPPPPPRQKPAVTADPAAPRPVASAARPGAEDKASAVPAVPQQPVEIAKIPPPPLPTLGLGEPTKLSPGEAEIDDSDAPRAPIGTSLSGVRVSVAAGPAGPVIAFEWAQPVAAAVFERAGFYWVVFDRVERAELLPIPPEVSDSVFLAEVVPNDLGTAFRFKVKPGLQATVSRDEGVWRVDFASRSNGPAEPIPVRRESTSANGPRVFLPIKEIGRRVDLNDPEVGDLVHVIPVLAAGQGVPVERAFVEFNLLATAQGVVVSPRSDDIAVRPLRNGVEISGPNGLILSALPAEGENEVAREAPSAISQPPDSSQDVPQASPSRQRRGGLRDLGPSLFKYAEWRGAPDGPFNDTRKHLNLSLAMAPRGAQNAALWNLAKFYFAYGMAADALGLTDLILQNNPSAIEDQAFKAVRGASFYLMGRFPEAERNLLDPVLGLDSGAALWRGAVFAAREDWAAARQEFEVANLNDEDVPPIFRIHFQLVAARASMLAGQAEDTEFVLKGVTEETARPDQLSEANLIRGQLQVGLGQNEKALETFSQVAKAQIRPTRPWARFAYTNARLELGELSTAEAIDDLEGLRHAWRGGEFEFRLLNRLSELYLQENQFRDALSTMRETVSNFNDWPGSKEITALMNELFRDLFLDHGADDVAPVSALALYFDFRELTPVGSDGDTMIRLLADRLVEVDLLGRAAQLIQHQVTFRLKGEEKARVGTKLAAIYLLDRQYDKAMEALRESRWRVLAKEIRNERKYLRAQAHIGLDEYEDALGLLRRDDSAAAETLRAEIYWKTSAWEDAADAFAAILDARQQEQEPLSTREQQQVMQMTVALALSDQRDRIATVRERYKALMEGTPEADAFEVLTGEVDRSSTSFRTVASKIAQIGTLESFMARYRDKLDEGGVGVLN
ncbi:MAG: hypothetical protein IH905_02070 [Proteobacteria bacterium]|nr:hypothetical protein [Pseudomonadota bacterium]